MDWKQFVSSIVGSLAWPSVVVILLILVRRQLVTLVNRLQELTLPGGAGAKFSKELEENRERIEREVTERPELTELEPPVSTESTRKPFNYILAEEFPEAAVSESFKAVENVITRNKWKVPNAKGSLLSYIKTLSAMGLINKDVVELFQSLRTLRNLAVHGGDRRITRGEALEYQDQARLLAALLEKAFDKLPPPGEEDVETRQ